MTWLIVALAGLLGGTVQGLNWLWCGHHDDDSFAQYLTY